MIEIDEKIKNLMDKCEIECKDIFKEIEQIEFENQLKVLNAFNKNEIQAFHFAGSTGYGHNDMGKQKLCAVFADVFHTEDAMVSPLISCGTEAISQTLLGLLRPGDTMLCISGTPYDTLQNILFGVEGKDIGSLKDYKINYEQVELKDEDFDKEEVIKAIKKFNPKMVYLQRSRGYSLRNALSIEKIERIIKEVKKVTNAYIVVDNCYGEFTETREPTDVGADVMMGSLIKNPGGGIAPTGGYIAGRKDLLEIISYKLTSPAVGFDSGSYEMGYKPYFEGFFVAPHVVAQAKKSVVLTSRVMGELGYETVPAFGGDLSDIVCCIKFNDKDKLINFIRGIQFASAVDSNSYLEPSEMEGYEDLIIMASGSFNQGSSVELSCDAPIRAPYAGYLQGCLTYSHAKIGLMNAIKAIL